MSGTRIAGRWVEGGLEAKFLPAAYFELLRHLEEDEATYWLEVSGRRYALARKSEAPLSG